MKWQHQLDGTHQPMGGCHSWRVWRGRVERMPALRKKGRCQDGLHFFFFYFLSHLSYSLLSLSLSLPVVLILLWMVGVHTYAYMGTPTHIRIERQTHAHVPFTGAFISWALNNNNSSCHLSRTFSMPALWSMLYNALLPLILKSSLWGSFYKWGSW